MLNARREVPQTGIAQEETGGPCPRTRQICIPRPIPTRAYLCCSPFEFGGVQHYQPGWTGEEVSSWIRLPHCSEVVNDGEAGSCPRSVRHLPDDHCGKVGRALYSYLAELEV